MDIVENQNQHLNSTRVLNFSLGLVLLALSLIFMFSSEVLAPSLGELDALLLGLIGFLSIRASFSEKESSVYGLNMFIGLLAIIGSGALWILQYFDPVSWQHYTAEEITPPLLMIQVALGLSFLAIAAYRKRRRLGTESALH